MISPPEGPDLFLDRRTSWVSALNLERTEPLTPDAAGQRIRSVLRTLTFRWHRWLQAAVVVSVWTSLFCEPFAQQAPPASSVRPRNMDYLKTAGGLPSMPSVRWVQKQPEPLDVHFAVERDTSRTDPPYNRGHILTRETPRGDPGVRFQAGDAVMTGPSGESWPIARATFESTYSAVSGGRMGQDSKFFKKPLPVLAVQMTEPFTVTASWGHLEGKGGDWIVQYDEAGLDFGIVGSALFERTYQRLLMTPELQAKLAALRERASKPKTRSR